MDKTLLDCNKKTSLNTIFTPTPENLERAKNLILQNQVVAMPTETVYGLAANAFSDEAVKNIYTLKGRPLDNPLIVHVHKEYDLEKIVEKPKQNFQKLIERLSPGPITFILKSKGVVSPLVSAGLDTVAVRIPEHAIAQAFLKVVNLPLAAPSANISTHTSPVTAKHVQDDFQEKLPFILDGGRCFYGLESTVCDITGEKPVILRSGSITAEEIAAICGDCLLLEESKKAEELKKRSPGTRYRHYAPHCKTELFYVKDRKALQERAMDLQRQNASFGILLANGCATEFANFRCYLLGNSAEEMAKNLYMHLRTAEKEVEYLLVLLPEGDGQILKAVQNRLKKACADRA